MSGARQSVQSGFARRSGIPRLALYLSVRASRTGLALTLALTPALALLLAAALAPPEFAGALTRTQNVHDTFARFLTAVTTASAIAVSVTTLTLRRELHGIEALRERHESNLRFREHVGKQLRAATPPVMLGPFLAEIVEETARLARDSRERLGDALRVERRGVTLGQLLDELQGSCDELAARLRDARSDPDVMMLAVVEREQEVTGILLAEFAEAREIDDDARAAVHRVQETFRSFDTGSAYLKTLATQWGLSRMTRAILLTTLPAIVTSGAMVLTYGDGLPEAIGTLGAATVVCAAFVVALFPVAAFVSYLLRFVLIHQHTLPTAGFVLGPEDAVLAKDTRGGD